MSGNGRRPFELASGRQLWRLNVDGLLHTAVARSYPYPVTKATAWDLLSDSNREKARCPGDCLWPRSCALHGCWLLECETAGDAKQEPAAPI